MRSRLLFLCLCVLLLLPGMRPAQSAPQVSPPVDRQPADEHFDRFTLQAATPLHILLQTPVSTETNQMNDPVEAVLAQNLYLGADLLLSKKTRLFGRITRLEPPIQGRDAILEVRFTDILLDNGERLPIAAHVRTEHPEHIWGGKVTEGTKPVLITQNVHAIGQYNRVMFRGPRRMGSHVVIGPGDHWVIILEQPLTLVKPNQPD